VLAGRRSKNRRAPSILTARWNLTARWSGWATYSS